VTEDPTAFEGWIRVGRRPWAKVCCACTRELCMTLLLAHELPPNARQVERCVRAKGEVPGRGNWR
jgi:hypothetical protein